VRAASVSCLSDDSVDCREHIFYAMVELRIQKLLMFLCTFARSYVTGNPKPPDGLTFRAAN